MSETEDLTLKQRNLRAARAAADQGKYILAATLYRTVAELELEEAIGNAAETAWNGRTASVPLLTVPMRTEHPRKAQDDEFPCIHGYKTYTGDAGLIQHISTGGLCDPRDTE